ncbi:MAG: hypothetical protein ACLPPF_18530 [Rhodomicrobium sp.]
MHRNVIACEFYRTKRAAGVADTIRKLASQWEHPLAGVWIVETSLSAGDIRSLLLSQLDFQDRVLISEAGRDAAEFNTMPASGGKVTQVEHARTKSRMLAGIFGRDGKSSRHLMAATSKNLRSA